MSQTDLQPWQRDKTEADTFTGQVASILRRHAGLFVEVIVADEEADRKRATDFIVRVRGGDIACRIRKASYLRYGDVTIRNERASGAKTEADKIIEGHGEWMFYGWGECERIVAWLLLDLGRLRATKAIEMAREAGWIRWNADGETSFIYLPFGELRRLGLIAASNGLP